MKKEKRKNYKHEDLMEYLNLSQNDLPQELQEGLAEFDRIDAKIVGYQPELEPASKQLASDIQEWYDEEEELLPLDENERACHVAFYVLGLVEITPAQFRELGGAVRLNGKNAYKMGDKYQLDVADKKKGTYKIRSLQEEQD